MNLVLRRVSGDPLAKLPVPHKMAVLATMDEVNVDFRMQYVQDAAVNVLGVNAEGVLLNSRFWKVLTESWA